MSKDEEKLNPINIFLYTLMIVSVLPLLLPLIVLCLACLCLPLFASGALVYIIYCEGLFASTPWVAWPFSIWIISIGLFWSSKIIFDTFYTGN